MTALISCFARCYHYKNYKCRIFSDSYVKKILSDNDFHIYEHLNHNEMTENYFKIFNHMNPDDKIYAPKGVNYCLAVKKTCYNSNTEK